MALAICFTFGSSRWSRFSDSRLGSGSLCRTARAIDEQYIKVGLERVSQGGRLGAGHPK
jgi:hypothetical protein